MEPCRPGWGQSWALSDLPAVVGDGQGAIIQVLNIPHWELQYSKVKKDLSTKGFIFMGWCKPRRRVGTRAARRSREGFAPETRRQKWH